MNDYGRKLALIEGHIRTHFNRRESVLREPAISQSGFWPGNFADSQFCPVRFCEVGLTIPLECRTVGDVLDWLRDLLEARPLNDPKPPLTEKSLRAASQLIHYSFNDLSDGFESLTVTEKRIVGDEKTFAELERFAAWARPQREAS